MKHKVQFPKAEQYIKEQLEYLDRDQRDRDRLPDYMTTNMHCLDSLRKPFEKAYKVIFKKMKI
jgi:hypothetical protein